MVNDSIYAANSVLLQSGAVVSGRWLVAPPGRTDMQIFDTGFVKGIPDIITSTCPRLGRLEIPDSNGFRHRIVYLHGRYWTALTTIGNDSIIYSGHLNSNVCLFSARALC